MPQKFMNKYDKAIICLQQASQIASKVKFKRISNFYIDNIELAKQEINVSHFNKFDGVEEFYVNLLNKAHHNQMICTLKFNLGVLFLKQNRKEEAHECLKYVVKHGNKMFIVNKATELITDLKVNKE